MNTWKTSYTSVLFNLERAPYKHVLKANKQSNAIYTNSVWMEVFNNDLAISPEINNKKS